MGCPSIQIIESGIAAKDSSDEPYLREQICPSPGAGGKDQSLDYFNTNFTSPVGVCRSVNIPPKIIPGNRGKGDSPELEVIRKLWEPRKAVGRRSGQLDPRARFEPSPVLHVNAIADEIGAK